MKVQIYAVFDQATGLYERPFFGQTDMATVREFEDVCTKADTQFNKHPEHYSLMRLGIFDNTNGKVTDETNECLCTGLEAIARSQTVDKEQMEMFKKETNGSVHSTGLTD